MSAIAARRARLAAESSCEATPEPGPSFGAVNGVSRTDRAAGNPISESTELRQAKKRRPNREDPDAKRHRSRRDAADTLHSDVSSDVDAAWDQAFGPFFVPRSSGQQKNFEAGREIDDQGVPSVLCALNEGEALVLKGCGIVEVLHGSIEINGAHLSSQHRETCIFAPANAALPLIRALSSESLVEAHVELPTFASEGPIAALIRLSELPSTNLQAIGDVCPLFGRDVFTSNRVNGWPLKNFAPVQDQTGGMHAIVNPEWRDALVAVENHFSTTSAAVGMIRGPKRVGKSTFSRFSLQRLQSSTSIASPAIAYLDTDLGQPEFGLPETVSLHIFDSARRQIATSSSLQYAPSWASFRQAAASRFLGELSPKNDPDEYMKAIASLLEVYREQWQIHGIPLLVNTQGWVKGLGADLLGQLEQMLSTTLIIDVVEDSSSSAAAVWPTHCKTVTIQAPSVLMRERGLNSTEARQMNMTSYLYMANVPHSNFMLLHCGLQNIKPIAIPSWDFSVPLVSQRPYSVDIGNGLRGGLHLTSSSAHVDIQSRLLSLNGSHCALVLAAGQGGSDNREAPSGSPWVSALQEPKPSLSQSTWFGTAIVRSIDVETGHIHLVCPINMLAVQVARASAQHAHGDIAIALIKGSPAELPVWLSLDRDSLQACRKGAGTNGKNDVRSILGVPLRSVPYLDFTEGRDDTLISMKKRRVRRNLLRPSQRRQADDK